MQAVLFAATAHAENSKHSHQDLQQTVSLLTTAGVCFERYPFLEQDANEIWKTPDGACVAWCKDPDGNTVSFTQDP